MPARKKVAAKKATAKKTAKKTVTKKTKAAPPTGMSLHIGLNAVDPKHYAGWSGELFACENDARDMAAIATSKGIAPTILLTRDATRATVLAALKRAAAKLVAGDFFLLTYSGHGGQVPDRSGEEEDRADETWCFFDGQLLDDELYLALGRFAKGVRIFVLSDSCHSGTVTRARVDAPLHDSEGNLARAKLLPPAKALEVYAQHKRFYDGLQTKVAQEAAREHIVDPDVALSHVAVDPRLAGVAAKFAPGCILISGCLDNQTSLDGARNGAFTEQLLKVWRRGAFNGNYARFHALIKAAMPATQTPNLFTLGDVRTFVTQQPFQVSDRPGVRVTPTSARAFVDAARLPAGPRSRGAAVPLAFDTAKAQATVVGSDVLAFVKGVTAERREAIVNSSLLAQLLATKTVPDPAKLYDWYDAYFNVLTNVGWVVQDRSFAEYTETGTNFEAHKAILSVATTLLGAAPAALAIVKSVLDALASMDDSQPWITIFNRETQSARTARFQIGLAEQDDEGQFFVNVLAFGLEAKTKMTQVLFFRAKRQDATLRHYAGRVTINTTALDAVRDAIKAKLTAHVQSYVSQLPDL